MNFNIFSGGKWYEIILFLMLLPLILMHEIYHSDKGKIKKKKSRPLWSAFFLFIVIDFDYLFHFDSYKNFVAVVLEPFVLIS